MRTKLMILTALVFLLASCLPAQQAPVDVQPVVNTAVAEAMATNQSQMAEAVAMTVAAQQVAATPTAEEPALTEEPEATATATLEIPTLAILPTNTVVVNTTPRAKPQYACNISNRRPFDNTEFHRGAKFDIKWTIINTGTKAWPKGIDVKYTSGAEMTKVKRIEIPKALEPGQSYTIVLDAVAPSTRGRHVMTWTVDGPMCYPYTAINVTK
jgi:hypothetical protein